MVLCFRGVDYHLLQKVSQRFLFYIHKKHCQHVIQPFILSFAACYSLILPAWKSISQVNKRKILSYCFYIVMGTTVLYTVAVSHSKATRILITVESQRRSWHGCKDTDHGGTAQSWCCDGLITPSVTGNYVIAAQPPSHCHQEDPCSPAPLG